MSSQAGFSSLLFVCLLIEITGDIISLNGYGGSTVKVRARMWKRRERPDCQNGAPGSRPLVRESRLAGAGPPIDRQAANPLLSANMKSRVYILCYFDWIELVTILCQCRLFLYYTIFYLSVNHTVGLLPFWHASSTKYCGVSIIGSEIPTVRLKSLLHFSLLSLKYLTDHSTTTIYWYEFSL